MQTLIEGAKQWGIELSPSQVEQFRVYCEELSAWNRRINLTSITEADAVQRRHFLDSLSVLRLDNPDSAFSRQNSGPVLPPSSRIIDVGAGAGFPGLPVKIARPDVHLTLVESVGKKGRFLQHVASVLDLSNVDVEISRAETLAHDTRYREAYDVVLSRAVAALRTLVELCLPFARVGGYFVAYKKGAVADEVYAARSAIDLLGGRLSGIESYTLPGEDEKRFLVILQKVSPTPNRFPRQPGTPSKRPL